MKCVCRVFLPRKALLGKTHKLKHKLHIRDAGLLPIVMVQTPGKRVYFVHVYLFCVRMNKEINARDSTAAERFVYLNTEFFYSFRHLVSYLRRHLAILAVRAIRATLLTTFSAGKVFILKIEELRLVERPLALRRPWLFVPHDRERDFYQRMNPVLHEHFVILVQRDFYR